MIPWIRNRLGELLRVDLLQQQWIHSTSELLFDVGYPQRNEDLAV